MSEGEQKVPGFQVIVGLMRSGTSLLGHLLGEVGWARYAGESHVIFDGEEGVREAWSIIEPELPPELQGSEGPPFCDKVLVPGQVPDGGRFLARRAERVYLLLRHPLAVWRSLRDLGWEWGNWGYIIGQLEAMRRVVEWCPEGKLVAVGYSDLTTRTGRLSVFGRDVSSYREVLGWMISEEGYWNSFDFVYVDGSHRARDVLTDGVMSWNLLKYGGVIAFDDYEWKRGDDEFGWPRRGIDAFESVFRPELRLVKGGYRRIWQKVGSPRGE